MDYSRAFRDANHGFSGRSQRNRPSMCALISMSPHNWIRRHNHYRGELLCAFQAKSKELIFFVFFLEFRDKDGWKVVFGVS